MQLKIFKKHKDVPTPKYQTKESAGFDLAVDSFLQLWSGETQLDLNVLMKHSIEQGYITLRPNERVLIGTGLFIELPYGNELQIRDRSSVCLKRGLKVLNSPGTIDADYRGEIGIILINLTDKLVKITKGERIAQGVLCAINQMPIIEVDSLSETERGEGGFGSTGK